MVRSYKRGNGKRKYAQYDEDDVKAAIDAVKDGMSQAEASRRFSIPREPVNIFNFDETNITDDPGFKRVLVPRGIGRVKKSAGAFQVCNLNYGLW
ncbi:hypothetical protein HOLleu_10173 [Holothuria leucospilota]|uniref:HTH psq-type domain-containing protein n=1 Tax=Holothuria leucospilota TaxID=206669 RepID=A0A9Q1CDT1_HOLLE|nr:hypothetical protein HOLleu_10173 [Holothuria leucospilota]